MTIADLAPVIEYLEDGVSLNFPVPFRFLAPEDLTVWRDIDGLAITLAYGAEYYATGGETDAGGSVVLLSTLSGGVLHIERHTPLSQDADYQTNDRFPAETHEGVLDKLMAIAQEQDAGWHDLESRALRVPPGETIALLPPEAIRAQGILGFDAEGDPLIVPAVDIGGITVIAQRREIIAAAGQVIFKTNVEYTVGYVGVYVNGVRLSIQEFTATNGIDVVLHEPAAEGDVVLLEGFLGSAVAGDAGAVLYNEGGPGGVTQTVQEAIKRERLNLYDRVPRELWAGIAAHTNAVDLTPYVMSALDTGRGINVPPGRFRMAATVNGPSFGASMRGEGRQLTFFENVDNRPIIKLDSSADHIFGFELEDMWLENRAPSTFDQCDLLVITGAGNGELFQNDSHHFRGLWFFQGRDNIACYNRCIWPVFDDVKSTGALRDALHVQVSANVNQWTLRDMVLKGAGRFGLFFQHDITPSGPAAYGSPATNWTLENISTEDCNRGGWRFFGSGGFSGLGARQCTFENNAHGVPVGSSAYVEGIRQRKTNVFLDCPYAMGFDFNGCSLYGANVSPADHPDWHIFVEGAGAAAIAGEIANCRFLPAQPTGGDVNWPTGLFYHVTNFNSGLVSLDRRASSIDQRLSVSATAFTPVLTFGGANAGMVPSNQKGQVTVNGIVVTFSLYFSLGGAKGSSAGVATISGLPYPLIPFTNLFAAFPIVVDGLAGIAGASARARLSPGGTSFDLYFESGGGLVPMTEAHFGNFASITISGSYFG